LVSDNERPEISAFRELEQLVRHLGDELATFRRRALQAESQLRSIEARGGGVLSSTELRRIEALEVENLTLRRRVEGAAEQTKAMLERVRFLRQQSDQPVPGIAGAGSLSATAAGERAGGGR
jgi:hypothetical protein